MTDLPATGALAADELRTAVHALDCSLLDDSLTPGPWLSMDWGDRIVHAGPGETRYVVDEPMSNSANATYLALMHPGVGALIRTWLHDCALYAEQFADYEDAEGSVRHALDVARLINRRPRL